MTRVDLLMAVLGAVAGALAVGLVVRARRERAAANSVRRAAEFLLALLPGALTVYLSFVAGGFFPAATASVALLLGLLLALRLALEPAPFPGAGLPLLVAVLGFALLSAWTLASSAWSHSLGRALVEFDRVLAYGLALALFASVARSAASARVMVRGLALAFVVVCVAGLLARTLPELLLVAPGFDPTRLSYPTTYWNSMGLLAALGLVLTFHLAADGREPALARVLGAAAAPPLAACLLLTLSRGGIVAAALGLLAYALIGRPRGMLSAALSMGPPGAVAVWLAYEAELLTSTAPQSAPAAAQGEELAVGVALCVVVAVAVRVALLRLDAQLERVRLPASARRPLAASLAVLALVGVVGASLSFDLPGRGRGLVERFVQTSDLDSPTEARDRLTDPFNNGRIDQWRVALAAFAADPVTGHGAGTFELLWSRERPRDLHVTDAHSLYFELLGELGIVGLGLLAVALGSVLVALAVRTRRAERALWGSLLAAGLAWSVRAGADWDWEMPAVTLWLFCAGGVALARPIPEGGPVRPRRRIVRLGMAAAVLLVIAPSALLLLSERRLEDGFAGFRRGDCAASTSAARASTAILDARAEPYELVGLCEARTGHHEESVRALRAAVRRDPESWEYRYALALVLASAGRDPRSAVRVASRLNPRHPLPRDALRRFRGGDSRSWRRAAIGAPLPYRLLPRQPGTTSAAGLSREARVEASGS